MHEPNDDELEHALRAALLKRPAPDGFADRTVARLKKEQEVKTQGNYAVPRGRLARIHPMRTPGLRAAWRSGIAAILLMTAMLGAYFKQQRQERIAGERARQRVLLALRIAGTTILDVRTKVDRGHFNEGGTGQEREP